MYILRREFGFWWAVLNIAMSLAGALVSPLYFSFHLVRIRAAPCASQRYADPRRVADV